MFENIKKDIGRYERINRFFLFQLGFWVVATYRYGHWIGSVGLNPLKLLLIVPYYFFTFFWRFTQNVYFFRKAKIGGGLLLLHTHSILVPGGSELGCNCTLHHEVTLGTGSIPGVPKIGNNVAIYPGARILGGVLVGDNVKIGANTVTVKNIPSNCIVPALSSRVLPNGAYEPKRLQVVNFD